MEIQNPKTPPVISWWRRPICAALDFLRLRDPHDGLLSLTNIAVIIALYKLAVLPDFTLTELSAFLGCLGLYHMKRRASLKIRESQATGAAEAGEALKQVSQAREELKAHTDKLRLMLDTVAMGRR